MTRPHPAESPRARHALFGGILAADTDLPGLPPATAGGPSPSWTLRTRDRTAADDVAPPHPLGRIAVAGGPTLALGRDGAALVLDVSDTGRFVVRDGAIDHARPTGTDPRAVALDLVGHVLPLALEQAGAWVLHASAVALPQGALVLVGPRGAGKSTLAAACALAGAPLVADDAVACTWRDGVPHALPAGLPLRLRPDVADALGVTGDDDGWGKRRLAVPLAHAPLPIAAIAFVTPTPAGRLARHPLPLPLAVAQLAAAGKLAALHGATGQGRALDRAAALASAVPVERLDVPRDAGAIAATARALRDAYAGTGAAA